MYYLGVQNQFSELLAKYSRRVLDIGTGDGKFILKSALSEPKTLWVGLDPAISQQDETLKKVRKLKLANLLFIQGSFEHLPDVLLGSFDEVKVVLPWGTLLESVVKPSTTSVAKFMSLFRADSVGARLTLDFGFAPELEPSETNRLSLGKIDQNYVESDVIPVFEAGGFKLVSFRELSKESLRDLGTTWGKKLSFGGNRVFFEVVLGV